MKKKNITQNILLAFLIGILIGILFNFLKEPFPSLHEIIVNEIFKFGGDLFLKILKMLVVPIVFCSLICGVCSLNDFASLGRMSFKTIAI